MASGDGPSSVFLSAPDGLRLHARCYGRPSSPALPVVCLPGLARTAADFESIATALTGETEHPRRVIALDYRGRGLSDYDRDPANYSFQTELADVLAVVTALEAMPAVFLGTSRGGILTMLLAALRPAAIAGVVLNDIGPVIEPKGLMRIKGYVGRMPQPKSLAEGAEILRRLFDAQFPKLTSEDWLAAAQRTFKQQDGAWVPTYDVRLAKTMEGIDFERPLPALWKEFDALANVPLMVVRGANSDLLSAATVNAMRVRRSAMETVRGGGSGARAASGGGGRDRAHRGIRHGMRRAAALALPWRARPFDYRTCASPATQSVIVHNYMQKQRFLYGRGGRIRTCDPLLPKQMRYRAALRPDDAARLHGRVTAGNKPQRRLEDRKGRPCRRARCRICARCRRSVPAPRAPARRMG